MSAPRVLGTGIDIVETERMRALLERWDARFKGRVFLPAEQAYCDDKAFPSRHYAGRFAVKEAVSKAFGTGIGPSLNWLDIEVVRDSGTGAPSVRMHGRAAETARGRGVADVLVSLSHTHNCAVAHALLLGRNDA
ncbi:MAG: holo-[acyl-carrier-protein] synthase [Lentisphaerae bacterium]|nr:holo-[acyl-carrier-protein] synthase [Lentisphaerota bacterium]